MNDKQVIEAAKNAVTVIVRRPHAYKFKRDHSKSPIPGLVVLNGAGEYLGGVTLPSKSAVSDIVKLMDK